MAKARKTKKQRPLKKAIRAKKQRPKKAFWQRKELVLPLLAVLLITAITFWPSLSNDFVNWDDDVNILDNKNLEVFDAAHIKYIFTERVMGGYNPLTIFTFALEKHFFGLDPFVFHLDNLLLHLVCVFFVYRLLLLLKLSTTASVIGALLFAIHPMRVESVAWATERKDVLFGAFYLAAMFTYIRYLQRKERKQLFYTLTLVLFVFSLFSKIQAVALPLSLLAIDYYFRRPLKQKLIMEKLPFFALSLLIGGLGIYFLTEADTIKDSEVAYYNFFQRLLIGAYSLIVYLVKFVFPYEMSPLYPYPKSLNWAFYAAPLGAFGFFYLMYRAFQKNWRPLLFGLAFFFVNIVFLLQVLGAGQGFIADRFTYIAYFGLFFLVAYGFDYFTKKYPARQLYLQLGAAAYLLLFAGMTFQQCKVWKNGGTLWTHVLKYYQKTSLPFGNLGIYYRENKDFDKAIENFNKAIKMAPGKATPYNSLGKTWFDKGDVHKALANYNKAIELEPDNVEFRVNRGAAYGALQRYELALQDFNEAEKLDPAFKNLYLNRSLVHNHLQNYEQAIADHTRYLELDPYHAGIYYERGLIKRYLGRYAEAMKDLNQAIRLDPNSQGLFYLERSKTQFNLGNKAAAQQDARQAQQMGIQVDPTFLQQLQ